MNKPIREFNRRIHLDFHTPGFVEVGESFNVGEFFDTLEESEVNSLVFFAKCHHGYSYFDTTIGTVHPGLTFDMFGEAAVEAARRGIEFLAYFSLNVDEVIADKHPEWIALNRDEEPVDTQILQDGSALYWRWLCPNRGGYLQDFFYPHVQECLNKYPIDGVFIDMAGYLPGSCFCANCVQTMRGQRIDPYDDVSHNKFNSHNMQLFATRLREIMDAHRPGMSLEVGCFNAFGEANKAFGVLSDFYVESLPYQMGWLNFPFMGRYLSNAGLPVIGYTGRFLKNWGDFGTVVSAHQMKIQLAAHLSIGASSGIGDHMHFNGRLEEAVYSTIKESFSFIKERQSYCCGMERAKEIAVLVPTGIETNAAVNAKRKDELGLWDSLYGAAKLFMEGHYQWDVISRDADFEGLSCLVVVDPFLDQEYIGKLEQFVYAGGTLIVHAGAILVDETIVSRWHEFIGLEYAAMSPYPGAFYRITDEESLPRIPKMAHYVHAPSVELRPLRGTDELARAYYSPCVRSREMFYGHFHGPDVMEGSASIVSVRRGRGKVIALGQSVLDGYLNSGYYVHRQLMHKLFDSVLPDKIVKTNAPSLLEITVGEKDSRTVLQFIPFISDRRHRDSFESLNECLPISDITVDLRAKDVTHRVFDPISQCEVEFTSSGNRVSFSVQEIVNHHLVILEHS